MLINVFKCIWTIDSWATHQMTYNKALLFYLKPLVIPYLVNLPNDYKVKATCTGSLYFLTFTFHNVLYLSLFLYNLIFVSQLVSQIDCIIQFSKFSCFLQAPSLNRPLKDGKLDEGLYKLHQPVSALISCDKTLLDVSVSAFISSISSVFYCNDNIDSTCPSSLPYLL